MALHDLFASIPVIETEHLRLRATTPEDAKGFFAFQSDALVLKYFAHDPFTTVEQSREYILENSQLYGQRKAILWGIADHADRIIGRLRLKNWDHENQCTEVGYMLNQAYWGKGYMSEALSGLISYCFTQSTVHRIEGMCLQENIGSARVMQKAGMQAEGVMRERYQMDGIYYDMHLFGIVRTDVQASI